MDFVSYIIYMSRTRRKRSYLQCTGGDYKDYITKYSWKPNEDFDPYNRWENNKGSTPYASKHYYSTDKQVIQRKLNKSFKQKNKEYINRLMKGEEVSKPIYKKSTYWDLF